MKSINLFSVDAASRGDTGPEDEPVHDGLGSRCWAGPGRGRTELALQQGLHCRREIVSYSPGQYTLKIARSGTATRTVNSLIHFINSSHKDNNEKQHSKYIMSGKGQRGTLSTDSCPTYCILHSTSEITGLPKVIWEEGRVAALSHTDAVKSSLVTMARPKFAPKSTPSHGPIPKPHYLPHLWTRPTYDTKRQPDPIRRFATMHWTDRPTDRRIHVRTDRQIVHGKVWRL